MCIGMLANAVAINLEITLPYVGAAAVMAQPTVTAAIVPRNGAIVCRGRCAQPSHQHRCYGECFDYLLHYFFPLIKS
jgi:hypothetical protein